MENVFAENEQAAFGTGVLVDGLDFSDDKMLVGRTFSYSDTQWHRVGTDHLQLPANAPATAPNTNLSDAGSVGPPRRPGGYVPRTYRTMPDWERDDRVLNLVDALSQCEKVIQEKMTWHFSQCDDELGRRVAQGIGLDYETAKA